MKINRIYSDLKSSVLESHGPLARRRAEQAQREFNVWAWERNRQGRQARLGSA